VKIEVDQPERFVGRHRAGDRPQPDRAVAAEDECDLAIAPHPAHRSRELQRVGHDRLNVLRSGMVAIGPPAVAGEIAVIDDVEICLSQTSTRPAFRSACGAFSWPGATAPALLGVPMMPTVPRTPRLLPAHRYDRSNDLGDSVGDPAFD
jgi:hypothetical protein